MQLGAGFPGGVSGRVPTCRYRRHKVMQIRSGSSLSQEDPLEEGMTIHSSILAWRISWTEEPGRL